MADSETSSRDTAAELRITRVTALSNHDLVAVVTYLLARHPDTFPAMLDDALSSVSPKQAASLASGSASRRSGRGRTGRYR